MEIPERKSKRDRLIYRIFAKYFFLTVDSIFRMKGQNRMYNQMSENIPTLRYVIMKLQIISIK
jgi:5-methylcytosine-specific restriction endonuclease McrBC regulatory subunit McrC